MQSAKQTSQKIFADDTSQSHCVANVGDCSVVVRRCLLALTSSPYKGDIMK